MDLYNVVSFAGIFILLAIAWLLSADRKHIQSRTIVAGVFVQFLFGAVVFLIPFGSRLFLFMSKVVVKVLDASREGIAFCFGPLAVPPGEPGSLGFILAIQGLATIVFFAALMELLYYFRVLPFLLKWFSRFFTWLMRISGAESLCATSNVFVGIESATTIRPYLGGMTRSELCTIFTAFMATIASSVLGLYVLLLRSSFPHIAGHLISASLLSAPAAIVMSKMLLPETGKPETLGLTVEPHYNRERNPLEAVIFGASAGGKLVFGVIVLLLALVGLVALLNGILGSMSSGIEHLTGLSVSLRLENLLSYLFAPFALIIGVPPSDVLEVARLLGERAILTEIPAYQHLAELITDGQLEHGRSAILASYALCGFTHIASIAIFIGGVSALAPKQTRTLSEIAWRAFVAATLTCLMTACVAGTFYGGGSVLFGP